MDKSKDGETHSYEDGCIFCHSEMDSYAMENVNTERKRIYGILSRILKEGEPITQEVLSKVILGNKK